MHQSCCVAGVEANRRARAWKFRGRSKRGMCSHRRQHRIGCSLSVSGPPLPPGEGLGVRLLISRMPRPELRVPSCWKRLPLKPGPLLPGTCPKNHSAPAPWRCSRSPHGVFAAHRQGKVGVSSSLRPPTSLRQKQVPSLAEEQQREEPQKHGEGAHDGAIGSAGQETASARRERRQQELRADQQ